MRTHKIAAIPADGIGPEVISAGIDVLTALAALEGDFGFEFEHFDWGTDRSARIRSRNQVHVVQIPARGLVGDAPDGVERALAGLARLGRGGVDLA